MVRIVSVLSLCVVVCLGEEISSSCASESEAAVKGSAMLQLRHESTPTESTMLCSLQRAQEEPLTEEGFNTISKSCCYEDVKAYTLRLIDSMGNKVCNEGGLSGLAPFYSCPLTPVTFAELKDELSRAKQGGNSKCHWIADRYEECVETALECGVSAMRPSPAPKPVASGFIALMAANPSEMVRSSRAIDVVKNDLALELGLDTSYVNVVVGSGPLDGEEVVSSFVLVPTSQAFFSSKGKSKICKVFAVYSIQEPVAAGVGESLTTAAPTLNEADVVNRLKHLNTAGIAQRLTQDLASVDGNIGAVEVMETSTCERSSGKCSHEIISNGAAALQTSAAMVNSLH